MRTKYFVANSSFDQLCIADLSNSSELLAKVAVSSKSGTSHVILFIVIKMGVMVMVS